MSTQASPRARRATCVLLPTLLLLFSPASPRAEQYDWNYLGPNNTELKHLAVDPSNSDVIYAAGGNHDGFPPVENFGLIRSTNGGKGWFGINTGLGSPLNPATVFALAIDPSHTDTIYAGTWSFGVYKSTNRGDNWTRAIEGMELPGFETVSTLAIDPDSPQTIYAGTDIGEHAIYKSTDGAAHWVAQDSGLRLGEQITSLAIADSNPRILYAGTYGDGIFKTSNGAGSWTAVNNGLDAVLAAPAGHVTALAVDPSNADIAYAGVSYVGVFKTTNGGASWASINNGLSDDSEDFLGIDALRVDPGNPNNLFIALTVLPVEASVFVSTNAGASWQPAEIQQSVNDLAFAPSNTNIIYAGTSREGLAVLDQPVASSGDGGCSVGRSRSVSGVWALLFVAGVLAARQLARRPRHAKATTR